jgi:hypothetical protein
LKQQIVLITRQSKQLGAAGGIASGQWGAANKILETVVNFHA